MRSSLAALDKAETQLYSPAAALLILVIGLVDGHPLPVDLELVGGDLLHVVICRLGRHGLELHLECLGSDPLSCRN